MSRAKTPWRTLWKTMHDDKRDWKTEGDPMRERERSDSPGQCKPQPITWPINSSLSWERDEFGIVHLCVRARLCLSSVLASSQAATSRGDPEASGLSPRHTDGHIAKWNARGHGEVTERSAEAVRSWCRSVCEERWCWAVGRSRWPGCVRSLSSLRVHRRPLAWRRRYFGGFVWPYARFQGPGRRAEVSPKSHASGCCIFHVVPWYVSGSIEAGTLWKPASHNNNQKASSFIVAVTFGAIVRTVASQPLRSRTPRSCDGCKYRAVRCRRVSPVPVAHLPSLNAASEALAIHETRARDVSLSHDADHGVDVSYCIVLDQG